MIENWGWVFIGFIAGVISSTAFWGWIARNTTAERKRLLEKIVIPLRTSSLPYTF